MAYNSQNVLTYLLYTIQKTMSSFSLYRLNLNLFLNNVHPPPPTDRFKLTNATALARFGKVSFNFHLLVGIELTSSWDRDRMFIHYH